MRYIERTIKIALFNIKKWFINPRIYILVILLGMYCQFMIHPIKEFCEGVGIGGVSI